MTEEFHNRIAKLCINHFKNLPKTGKPTKDEWTVLSCIVKQNTIKNHLEVVSLGTGSKCIGKTKMSPNGDILNDSHAEIICRRTFLRYLYEEISSKSSEIFTLDCGSSKFCLKDAIKFHFFTSHVPCGDAAIFAKQDDCEFGALVDSKPNEDAVSLKRPAEGDLNNEVKRAKSDADIFRTGAKCLPDESKQDLCHSGLGYHTVGAVRTKPGRGDPTLSLSCSDKMAKWCQLGVQGAFLSLCLNKAIYLSSLTVAGQTPYCEKALSRALFGRFPIDPKLPYRGNTMAVAQAGVAFEFAKTDHKNPCPSSIAWCKTNSRGLEVAVEGRKQGVTKKKQNTKAGRLQISKIEIFRTFLGTIKRLNLDVFDGVDLNTISYKEAKAKAKAYQEAWAVLKSEGFKVWTVKDDSLLRFVID